MTSRNTRAAVSVVLLCAAVGAGCSHPEAGTVVNDPPAAPAPSAGGAPRYPSRGVFGDVKACELLDQALAGQGYPPGEESTLGSDNGCHAFNSALAGVDLDLDDVQDYGDLRTDASNMHDGAVNGRPAVQVREGSGMSGTCQVSMRVAVQARALVTVGVGKTTNEEGVDTNEACRQAGEIASVVEPGLPEQG